jgi:hypothetical protein
LFDAGFRLDEADCVWTHKCAGEQIAWNDFKLEAFEGPGKDGSAEDKPEEDQPQGLGAVGSAMLSEGEKSGHEG